MLQSMKRRCGFGFKRQEFIEYEQEKISFLKRYVEVGEECGDSSDDESSDGDREQNSSCDEEMDC